jgi:transcriptional regulator with XRE-family HTH domain
VGIDWKRFAAELKRRRDKAGMTQDGLAAKIGVRWNTIARLETGKRRPSIEMLEKLAEALQCRIWDLLPEEELPMATRIEREPSMRGAPSYFRARVVEARERRILGRDMNTGKAARADYSHPGWHLAIHVDDYLEDEALEDLAKLSDLRGEELERELLAFFDKEFPGCMALIPRERRSQFMRGVFRAIEDERFNIG